MSETSEDTIQSGKSIEKDNVCRDFARGMCNRNYCKYRHENEIKPLNFCHDFQNNVCPRLFCKFIHCFPNEAEHYKRTGRMTPQILSEVTRKNLLPDPPPACDQFKRGKCRRSNCKYRHITQEQEEAETVDEEHLKIRPTMYNDNNNISESQWVPLESVRGILRRNGVGYDEYKEDDGIPLLKRRFISTPEPEMITCDYMEPSRPSTLFNGYFAGNPPTGYFAGNPPTSMLSRAGARSLMLEEENALLLKENARLKKHVSNLTATNEFLLDQNAALRVNGKRNGNVPTVNITNSQSPQQVNRTVIASVATVPVSLATVSTCNPVSITGCPAVSMAPAQILANSQQILVTTNPTTQLALANSSQAQLAIAQQNLATNLAAAQQAAQPQLTSQAQQLALATTTQQLTSQAQHMANQQMALATAAAAGPQLTTQTQQIALANNAQAQQLIGTNQQLTSQAQQLALASTNQQLTSQAQQLALATTNQPQQLTVTNVNQQLALASTNQQLIAQQNLASEIHRSTSQAIAMSNAASQPMVSFPIMTQSINHAMTH